MAQVVECLPHKYKALSSNPSRKQRKERKDRSGGGRKEGKEKTDK
jgi:hypothetical protein